MNTNVARNPATENHRVDIDRPGIDFEGHHTLTPNSGSARNRIIKTAMTITTYRPIDRTARG
ncbi:hypothetical protein [Sinorhizobium meliloti]|uniref:hypothetical protein n=1 Tax=Rhizobium meliloti TaxID=382 RepID=UPI00238076AF|nr:hypothetical protein [Sinorhizobium meliloti]MDE3768649.1 hypothetical protein [Sinorhizobium meliloti]